jgi:ABC-type branched-subunit amino acid transport system permease subunit
MRPTTSPWPAILSTAAIAATSYVFLRVEEQWEVGALAAVIAIVLVVMSRTRFPDRASAGWSAHPRLLGSFALLAGLVLVTTLREDHFALLMLAKVMLFGIACLGLTIQFGFAGVVNFSGAAFFGVGAYTAAVLAAKTGTPHLLVLLAGAALAALIGSVLVLPLLRTRGHYAALITVAFAILFKTFLEVNDVLGGPQGLKVPGLTVMGWSFNDPIELSEELELSFYVNYALAGLALFALTYALVQRLERSWLGLSLDAVRIDETSAAALGFDVARWKIFAFMAGNFLAGLAGAFYAMMTGFVAPASFTLSESLIFVSIVILGGLGNLAGILPATALVVVLPEKLQVIQEYRFLLFSVVVILVLLFRPEGLLPRRLRSYVPGWGRS